MIVSDLSQCIQRPLHFAIVDEVDSILIDEARTPLIISGPTDQTTDLYYRINSIIPQLKPEHDYTIEEKTKPPRSRKGQRPVENCWAWTTSTTCNTWIWCIMSSKRSRPIRSTSATSTMWSRTAEVIIVDEFTGRLMPGRRWSDGLHQAVEAKEGVKIANERTRRLASVTFQTISACTKNWRV